MITDETLQKTFYEVIREENDKEREAHEPSGKLSASMLGEPLQWQYLKLVGVPPKDIDNYTLGVFLRGTSVEDTVLEKLEKKLNIVEKQKEVTYRDTVGLVDAIIDTKGFEFECGVIPVEIKSVKNSKFKHIVDSAEADENHKLQACLYALAMGTKHYCIAYIAADDFRIKTFIYETSDISESVEKSITDAYNALRGGIVPAFEAKHVWQSNPQYCKYPEFMDLTLDESLALIKEKYPELYKLIKKI